ncbi:glycosyltransferase family 32 protein [Flavivirga algicola]|uniref:Mannosyltransferase n=1 Tax=Flavivirga algicola TaxID=2729136 RepID=A0ABX1RUB1_9FLAO|nr:glycosyltransferase [Flavivirga algicola]NMH86353.1 mannosyltransferase [Flavivirga algicola]
MIPKIIHYCWFGKAEKPKLFAKCLESWNYYCPDFEIKEWHEGNIKQFKNKFIKDALRKKKYAFVADAVRMQIVLEFGGVYLDTDMLLLKPLDELLTYNFFIGNEVINRPAFGIFGVISKHRLIQEMVDFYNTERFDQFSAPVITHKFKHLIKRENLIVNERILDVHYFYPLPYENRLDDYAPFCSENTIAVHLWDHSWGSEENESLRSLFKNLQIVIVDYLIYGYSYAYFKRYFRGFSRKVYHHIKRKMGL